MNEYDGVKSITNHKNVDTFRVLYQFHIMREIQSSNTYVPPTGEQFSYNLFHT